MKTMTVLATLVVAAFCTTANAQNLPKSGTIRWHTAYMVVAEVQTVAEGYLQGHGDAKGVTYNDSGAGPLHLGPVSCLFTFFMIEGRGDNQGYCAFGDADGDRIFTDWTGEESPTPPSNGTNVIVGGTGKYAGITGSGPWFGSGPVGSNGGFVTLQRLDYELP